jgi:glucose-1-phosphate thymidylyltransferase
MVSKAVLFAPAAVYRCCEPWARSSRRPSSRVALLPVGNKPLVRHALEDLADAGIVEVAVVTAASVAAEVHEIVGNIACERLAATQVVTHDGMFIDALEQVAEFVGTDPFLVHLGDSLTRVGLAPAIAGACPGCNDVMALIEENRSQATPLARGLASLPTAGIYVFGPGVLQLATELDGPADWDLEIAGATERLIAAGGQVELRPVRDWWRFREGPDALLHANRFFLAGLRAGPTDALLENTGVEGPVALHPTAQLTSTTVRGPVIIGPRVEIRDAYIGPYTSIGANVVIENAEVEHSVILPGASIRHLGGRLDASVVGPGARIFRDFRLPRALRVNVGEGAEIAIT